jgi:hypothetical protein
MLGVVQFFGAGTNGKWEIIVIVLLFFLREFVCVRRVVQLSGAWDWWEKAFLKKTFDDRIIIFPP